MGSEKEEIRTPRPAIKNQILVVRKVWNNTRQNDFGIERIIRLISALLLFLFPGLYIRNWAGYRGTVCRKLAVEGYVLVKLLLPICLLCFCYADNFCAAIVCAYMGIETINYLVSLIFLSSEFTSPISHRRSIATLFLNYLEVTLDFAVIYTYISKISPCSFSESLSGMKAVYFSIVTSTTVGYGDILPKSNLAMILVTVQMILFLIFVGLFVSYFTSKVDDKTYYNKNNNQ